MKPNIRRIARYPLLFLLIMQLGITSLLCAVSSYQAEASTLTICTSFGLKTITIDENGNQIEQQAEHARFDTSCFHCTSGGCTPTALLTEQIELYLSRRLAQENTDNQVLFAPPTAPIPPTRAPPYTV